MIGQFDFSQKGYVSGRGRSAVWRELPFDGKTIEPQFMMALETYLNWPKAVRSSKLAFMDVASATNARSFIGSFAKGFPGNHKTPVLTVANGDLGKTLLAAAVLNSFAFDYALRCRLGGLSLGWFILEESPFPSAIAKKNRTQLVISSCRLSLLHRLFAPDWLKLKALYPDLAAQEWKKWWAVTESDRLRLRTEIDAICADQYGLDPDDFDWMLHEDSTDPKGFHRVDKRLPFRERLTGLAAAAFRALKEGKWSAESAAKLSNDEFFEIIGIPELTAGPEPLIRKRTGCHVWKPEAFGKDDPRHGWTWDHCWQDAVALLGSDEAVQKYIEGDSKPANGGVDQPQPDDDGPKDLFGNRIPTDLFGSELRTKPRKKK